MTEYTKNKLSLGAVICMMLSVVACASNSNMSYNGIPLPVEKPNLPDRYSVYNGEDVFPDEEMLLVSSQELGAIRGGFMANGIMIDIGIATQTIVNNILVESTEIRTSDPATIDPALLQTLVQIDEGGASARKLGLSGVPSFITALQNSLDNVEISSITNLEVDVSNSSSFTMQSLVPGLNHLSTLNIR